MVIQGHSVTRYTPIVTNARATKVVLLKDLEGGRVSNSFNTCGEQDGAHEPECKHVPKATYVQVTLL